MTYRRAMVAAAWLIAAVAVLAGAPRWEFMLSVAPIPVTGGTGGPVNALATF